MPSGEMRTARICPALSDSTLTLNAPSTPPPTLTDEAVAGPHTHPKRSTDGPRGACPGRKATVVPPRCAYTPSVPLQAISEESTGETVGLEASVTAVSSVTEDEETSPIPPGPAPTRVSSE